MWPVLASALLPKATKAQTELEPGAPLQRMQSFQSNGTEVMPAVPLPRGLPAGAWVITLDGLFNDLVITYKGETITLTPDEVWNMLRDMRK